MWRNIFKQIKIDSTNQARVPTKSKHLHVLNMVTWKQHGFLNIIYLVCFYQSSQAYFNRCPEMVELELYSKRKCTNQKEYHCLEDDGIDLKNREECRTPEWVSIGNYPLFRGIYIDYEMCPVDSYQPSLFRSNENNKCVYLKSICSSEGQVEVNKGNKSSDIACRCDSTRGFAFIIRPKNHRACISSQEDCSCYSKRCSEEQKLNPDYECKTITVLHGNSTHHVVTVTEQENTSHNASFVVTTLNNVVPGKEGRTYGLFGLISLIVFVVTLTCAFSLASFIYPLKHLTKNIQSSQEVYNKPKTQEMTQRTGLGTVYSETASTQGNDQANYSKETYVIDYKGNKGNKDFTDIYKETAARQDILQSRFGIETPAKSEIDKQSNKGYTGAPDTESPAAWNKVSQLDTATNLIKTETVSLTSTDKADIIILHIEEENQKTAVKSFKFHLESLSKEMEYSGINIKLFEDVFHRKEDDTDIEIETVLKKCIYVFVYISKKSYPSKLRRLGLKESFIQDILEEPTSKTHVKIVCNCDEWDLPDYRDLSLTKEDIDLDYFHYVKEKPDIVMEYKNSYKKYLDTIQLK